MRYLVEELWHILGYDRPIAALAREFGIKREALSPVMNGKRGVSKSEAKKILAKYPQLRKAVIASLLDEDLDHRDYARCLQAAGIL
jgi:hypothetical protein